MFVVVAVVVVAVVVVIVVGSLAFMFRLMLRKEKLYMRTASVG